MQFYRRDLHTQTNTQVRDVILADVLRHFDFTLYAPLTKPPITITPCAFLTFPIRRQRAIVFYLFRINQIKLARRH